MQKMSVRGGFIVFRPWEGTLGLKWSLIMVVWHVSINTSNPICQTLSNGHNKVMPFFSSRPVLSVFTFSSPRGGADTPVYDH